MILTLIIFVIGFISGHFYCKSIFKSEINKRIESLEFRRKNFLNTGIIKPKEMQDRWFELADEIKMLINELKSIL